ncbi:hypothetical protein BH23VER1_BH23VER1_28630 [soil metagenome]
MSGLLGLALAVGSGGNVVVHGVEGDGSGALGGDRVSAGLLDLEDGEGTGALGGGLGQRIAEPPVAGDGNAPEVLSVRETGESGESGEVTGLGDEGGSLPVGEGGADPGGLIHPLGYEEDAAAEEHALGRHGTFRFSLDLAATYDSNIFIAPREEVADFIFVIQPGVEIGLGDAWEKRDSYLYLNYNPAAAFFAETSSENAVDQDLTVEVAHRGGRLGATGTARFQKLHGTVADIGSRADRLVYQAAAKFSYGWGGRTSVETGFYYEKTDYDDDFIDSVEYRNETFLAYDLSGKTTLGLGGAVGALDSDGSGTQQFVQALVRARTELTGKLSLAARGGVDFRDRDTGRDVTPVFGLGAGYQPADGTVITVDADRSVRASAAQPGEDYVRTAASVGVSQRVATRFNVGIAGGVENLDYRAVSEGVSGDREDTGYFLRPNIAYDFRENVRGELFFLYRENDSSAADNSYTSNQLGVSLGADF